MILPLWWHPAFSQEPMQEPEPPPEPNSTGKAAWKSGRRRLRRTA